MDERVVDVLELNRQLTDTFMESKRKYKMATKTKPAATETKAPAAKTGFTATLMAEKLGISAADLRKHLRSTGAVKPAGGWTWDSEKAASDVIKSVQARIKELATAPAKEKAAPKAAEKAPVKAAAKKPAPKAAAETPKPAAKKAPAKKPAGK